jgi:hypothetical protein
VKLFFTLALSLSIVGPALAHNETRDYKAPTIAREYSQDVLPGRGGPTAGNPDTSIPDRIATPDDNVRPSPAVAGN